MESLQFTGFMPVNTEIAQIAGKTEASWIRQSNKHYVTV